MELPAGSPWIHYTMESPWPVALICLALGLFLLKMFLFRQPRQLKLIAIAIILIAPVLVITAGLVETNAEQLRRLTTEFVETAVKGNRIDAGSYMTNDLTVVIGEDGTRWNKQKVLDLIGSLPATLLSNHIRRTEAVTMGANEGVSILVQTTTPGSAVPIPNRWRFRWVRGPVDGRWRIHQMMWEEWGIGQVPNAKMIP